VGDLWFLKSGGSYADTITSTINVSGQLGGQSGIVEIFGSGVGAGTVNSIFGNLFAILFNPYDMTFSGNAADVSSSNPNFNFGSLAPYSQIALHALDNIQISTVWDLSVPGALTAFKSDFG